MIFQHRLGVLTRSIARTPLLSPAEMAGSEMQRNAPKPWDPTKDREKPCWNCLELVVVSHWLLTIYLPVYMPRKLWKQCVLHVLQKKIFIPLLSTHILHSKKLKKKNNLNRFPRNAPFWHCAVTGLALYVKIMASQPTPDILPPEIWPF